VAFHESGDAAVSVEYREPLGKPTTGVDGDELQLQDLYTLASRSGGLVKASNVKPCHDESGCIVPRLSIAQYISSAPVLS
jgi:hypothetical protein